MQRLVIFVAAATPLYLVRFSVFGLPTTALELLIGVLCFLTIARTIVMHDVRIQYVRRLREIPRALWIGVVIFFIASCIAIVVAPDTRAAFGIWRAYVVEAIAFGVVAWLHLDSWRQFRVLAAALSVTAAFVAVVAIIQQFTGWGIPNPFWRAAATRRVTSIFGYPNAVGLYLELIVPFLIAGFLLAKNVIARAWFVILFCASVAAIIFAESSGTLAALVLTAGLFLLLWKRTRWIVAALFVCAVLAVAVSPLRKPFADEFLLQGVSGNLRTSMWKETVQMLAERPVTGAGLAGYQATVKPFHILQWAEIYLYPHNLILALWSELGLLGLLSFCWIFFVVAWWSVRGVCNAHHASEHRVWAGVVFASFFIIAIHGLVDTPYFKNDFSVLFWLIIAAALQVRYTQNSPNKTT